VLRPGGTLLVVDLTAHKRADLTARLAHRWPGFAGDAMHRLLTEAGLDPGAAVSIDGPLSVGIWPAVRSTALPAPLPREAALFA
jgi:ArsR family transcriptional regulator